MQTLPADPFILLSYVNTQLRDNFDSLAEMCATLDIDVHNLSARLASIGYVYNPALNKFI